jgi:hypothetical protein
MPLTPAELNALIDRRNPSGLDGAASNKRLVEILHALADASGGGGTQVNSDWDAVSGVAEILNRPETGEFGLSLLALPTPTSFFSLAGLGSASKKDVSFFATAAQGLLANTAVQPAALSAYELSLGNPVVRFKFDRSRCSFVGCATNV